MVNDKKQDYARTRKILILMVQSFDQSELDRLYFELGVDTDSLPKTANKQDYIIYLISHFARRNRQKELIIKLREKRPRLNWPETYTLPIATNHPKTQKSVQIGQYIQQNINLHTTVQTSKNVVYHKDSRLSPQRIAKDLYNKAFKYAPKIGWFILIIILLFVLVFIYLYFFNKQIFFDFGLIILIGIIIILFIIDKFIFSFLFNQVEKTDFYNLKRITRRKEVKRQLQGRKDWGGKASNWICPIVVRFWLEPDKNRANKRKIF